MQKHVDSISYHRVAQWSPDDSRQKSVSRETLVSFEFTIRYEMQLEGKAPFKRGLATALTSSSTNSYFLASTVA